MSIGTKIIDQVPIEWDQYNKPIRMLSEGLNKTKGLALQVKKASQEAFDMIKETVESTQLKPLIASINSLATDCEKLFNIINSTPVICIFGSYIRYYAGIIQMFAGMAIAVIGEICVLLSSEENLFHKKWQSLSLLGTEQVIHGCLNIIRSLAESYLATFTMSLGNLILYIPNMKKDFAPYVFTYGILVNQSLSESKKSSADENAMANAEEEKKEAMTSEMNSEVLFNDKSTLTPPKYKSKSMKQLTAETLE